ncbi:MAG: hypothetical protein E6G53_17245 [Actinobacteria bacterium]|nr:MAG: hypothetical protein E6G53_17245 [Actinomycetota bacterium]
MALGTARWTCTPYSVADAERLAQDLGVSLPLATVLVRRGLDSAEAARRYVAADERHDPFEFTGMAVACETILAHVQASSPIVVHGDYDVDGVCSTAILVRALRALGADPSWHIPARDDGYGVSTATVERLAAAGTRLILTADCAITSVEEVARAHELGIDVVVTDHHRPGERLPDCPIVHPGVCGYPFADLCAAGVAQKLSEALLRAAGADPAIGAEEADLVALATVADVVPLRGENRRLVRQGLRAIARTSRPGLRALMAVAQVDPGAVDERSLAFRLAPRINAAGRLARADLALELLLTEDPARAERIADELDRINRERQDVETRTLFAAEAARAEHAEAPAYVLAGEGWHPGVIGIVASRMVERHHRPCVLIALDGDRGRGSVGVLGAPPPLRRPPRRRRPRDRGGRGGRVPARIRPPRGGRTVAGGPRSNRAGGRRRGAGPARRASRGGARAAAALRAGEPRAHVPRTRSAGGRRALDGRRQPALAVHDRRRGGTSEGGGVPDRSRLAAQLRRGALRCRRSA